MTVLHKPGQCNGWWLAIHVDNSGQCYECWRRGNKATRKADPRGNLPQPPPKDRAARRSIPADHQARFVRSLDCIELGSALNGQTCGCTEKLRECGEHGTCTTGIQRDGVKCCTTCDDYDPECPDQKIIPHHNMSRRQLERVIALGERHWPTEALTWPVMKRTMKALAEAAVSKPLPMPELSGRGIVTCGGGRYNASLYVTISMIRRTGCTLPIQIWHHGPTEPIDERVLRLPGVTAHDTANFSRLRRRTGWPMKTVAWTNCRFAEFLFFDADCYPVVDPSSWFDKNTNGVVIFGDFDNNDSYLSRSTYPAADWLKAPPTLNGGHYVVDAVKAWPAISLAFHFDQHDDYWHQFRRDGRFTGIGGYSEQDQFRAALAITGAGWSMWPKKFEHRPGAFLHFGRDGEPAIVHRVGAKFAEPGAWKKGPRVLDWLPLESEAWAIFEKWKKT